LDGGDNALARGDKKVQNSVATAEYYTRQRFNDRLKEFYDPLVKN